MTGQPRLRAVSTEEEALGAKNSRATDQPPGPLEPPPPSEPPPSEPEVVIVVVPEPSSEPELDPEEPPSEEPLLEPSRPEPLEVVVVVVVLLLLSPVPCPSVVGWATAVVSPEPSCPLPEVPLPEDVSELTSSLEPDRPVPDVREPSAGPRECPVAERFTLRAGRSSSGATAATTGPAARRTRA